MWPNTVTAGTVCYLVIVLFLATVKLKAAQEDVEMVSLSLAEKETELLQAQDQML